MLLICFQTDYLGEKVAALTKLEGSWRVHTSTKAWQNLRKHKGGKVKINVLVFFVDI